MKAGKYCSTSLINSTDVDDADRNLRRDLLLLLSLSVEVVGFEGEYLLRIDRAIIHMLY